MTHNDAAQAAGLRDATKARAAAEARLVAEATLDELVAKLRNRVKGATPQQWHQLFGILFPHRGPYGLRLFADGRIEGLGAFPLSDEGEKQLLSHGRESAVKLFGPSWKSEQIDNGLEVKVLPFRLSVRV